MPLLFFATFHIKSMGGVPEELVCSTKLSESISGNIALWATARRESNAAKADATQASLHLQSIRACSRNQRKRHQKLSNNQKTQRAQKQSRRNGQGKSSTHD